ncbi:MAG: hypothetical protein ACTSPM_02780 [Candidatus Heimdallarchaeota archaeon]
MNKKLAIILPIGIIGLVIASVFLVPIIMYGGATVPVVEGSLSFESSESTLLGYSTQSMTPGIGNVNIDLRNGSVNAINYSFDGINGRNDIADDNPSADISLELSIKFVITKDGNVVKEIAVGVIHGEGMQDVSIMLGPKEGLDTIGTYELTIVISLKLHTPGTDLALDIELGPFTFYFNPQQEA